jgi:hypothetical protein
MLFISQLEKPILWCATWGAGGRSSGAEKRVREVRKWKGDDDRDLIGADHESFTHVKNQRIFISHITIYLTSFNGRGHVMLNCDLRYVMWKQNGKLILNGETWSLLLRKGLPFNRFEISDGTDTAFSKGLLLKSFSQDRNSELFLQRIVFLIILWRSLFIQFLSHLTSLRQQLWHSHSFSLLPQNHPQRIEVSGGGGRRAICRLTAQDSGLNRAWDLHCYVPGGTNTRKNSEDRTFKPETV